MAVFFSRRAPATALACAIVVLAFTSGCHRWTRRGTSALPYTTQPPAGTEINVEAQRINRRGIQAFERGRLADAESLFRKSLEADVSFGPAHNNLGQMYLARHQLYLAAWEFEYAANLMPTLVEPVINQGLAYETGGRLDRATEFYREAYQRRPDHPVAIASLVRALVKQDSNPEEIGLLLDELIMTDGRQRWVEWAQQLRATRYRDYCCGGNLHGAPDDTFSQPHRISPGDESYDAPMMDPESVDGLRQDTVFEYEESLELLPPAAVVPGGLGPPEDESPSEEPAGLHLDAFDVDEPLDKSRERGNQDSIGPLLKVSPLWNEPVSGGSSVPNDSDGQTVGQMPPSSTKPRPRRIDFDSHPDASPLGLPQSVVNQASFEEPRR